MKEGLQSRIQCLPSEKLGETHWEAVLILVGLVYAIYGLMLNALHKMIRMTGQGSMRWSEST